MKARSAWSTAFLAVLFGCGSGTIGTGANVSNGGPNGSNGNNLGDNNNGGGSGGSGGTQVSSPPVAGLVPCDGGLCNDAGVVVTTVSSAPPVSSSAVVVQAVARLTAVEYANTVNDLFTAAGIPGGVPPSEQMVPLDDGASAGGFASGGPPTDVTAQSYHDSAVQIATLVTSTTNLPSLLKAANCTAPTGNSGSAGATCAAAFVNEFLPLAFRHGQVDAATISGANGVYTAVAVTNALGFTAGITALVEYALQSPFFLYHLETEEQALGTTAPVTVTGYSMANRLSYLLYSSMPDGTLLTAAAANQLSTAAQVQAQAQRMVQDPKAKIGLRNFYQQWLTALTLPAGKVGNSTQIMPNGTTLSQTSLFQTTNGMSFETAFSPALQAAIVQSFDMEAEAALWSPTNSMKTLLTGTTAYANTLLAPVLGVADPGTTNMVAVQLDSSKRIGIMSHPLLMATYATTNTSHPIKRGRFIWDQIVCQPLPNPPAGVPAFVPPSKGMSLRQDFELLTATGPYAGMTSAGEAETGIPCPSCHARIDPPGFLFEPFDTMGDWRNIDDYGEPVDLTNITITGFTGSEAYLNVLQPSSMAFAQSLANSDLPDACITQQLYRFMARRNDALADYATETWLDQVYVASQENLVPVLVGLTQTDVFLERMNSQ